LGIRLRLRKRLRQRLRDKFKAEKKGEAEVVPIPNCPSRSLSFESESTFFACTERFLEWRILQGPSASVA